MNIAIQTAVLHSATTTSSVALSSSSDSPVFQLFFGIGLLVGSLAMIFVFFCIREGIKLYGNSIEFKILYAIVGIVFCFFTVGGVVNIFSACMGGNL